MTEQWRLIECNYCQGAIGDIPAWHGGYPFHKECLIERNSSVSAFIAEMQRQIKADEKRYPA
jgi:hypothetical protein